MSNNLTEILTTRGYDPNHQYELYGSPDGSCPFGKESVLEEIIESLSLFCINNGNDSEFSVTYDDFILIQICYYNQTIPEIDHHLKICDLIERYVKEKEVVNEMVQFRPYTIKRSITSEVMVL